MKCALRFALAVVDARRRPNATGRDAVITRRAAPSLSDGSARFPIGRVRRIRFALSCCTAAPVGEARSNRGVVFPPCSIDTWRDARRPPGDSIVASSDVSRPIVEVGWTIVTIGPAARPVTKKVTAADTTTTTTAAARRRMAFIITPPRAVREDTNATCSPLIQGRDVRRNGESAEPMNGRGR